MSKMISRAAFLAAALLGGAAVAAEAPHPPVEKWSWTGFFGGYDRAELQRGLQVYTEVCAACHGLKRVRYRNLADLGYSPEEIKAFAAGHEVEDGPDDVGEMFTRPALPSDAFVSPFPNDAAARAANGGALPPDLSLIVKARAMGHGNIPLNFARWMGGRGTASGADYTYHLLTGYVPEEDVSAAVAAGDLPHDFAAQEGRWVNRWFPGHNISMAPPLADGAVEYADGTEASASQMARDVTAFLAWASEPELETRKRTGFGVLLFVGLLLALSIAAKKRLWRTLR